MTRPTPGQPPMSAAPAAPGYPPAPEYAPPQYPPAPYPGAGYSNRAIMTPDGLPLAGAGYRLLARIIDGILVMIVSMVIGFPLILGLWDAMVDYMDMVEQAVLNGTTVDPFAMYSVPGLSSNLLGLSAVSLAVSGGYHITLIALRGATLGKIAVGVRVRPWDVDGRPSWGQATLRWATRDLGANLPLVGTLYWLLDSLWLLWDNQRQCLHDKLPKTCVIRSR